MAQMYTIGKVGTCIIRQDERTQVVYHGTPVVTFNRDRIILQTNGWYTATTKTRMNQAASHFNLGFRVFQKNYSWYVRLLYGNVVPFVEGMEIVR